MNIKTIWSSSILCFVFLFSGYSQGHFGRVFEELNSAISNGQSFPKIQLFSSLSPDVNRNFQKNYPKANYWTLDINAFHVLAENLPVYFSMELTDYQNNTLTVFLERQEVFGDDSRLLSSEGSEYQNELHTGHYYRGIIKEYPGSIAAFSFFEDQTIAVISLPEKGNLVFGKMRPASNLAETDMPHVLYYENELPAKSNFECGADLLPTALNHEALMLSPDTIYTSHCKTTKIFLECDYRLYTDYNRNVSQVKNYVTGLFNVVKTLYYNETVNIEISDIMVWTSQDPFLHTTLAAIIYDYAAYRKNNFVGNLAQLVTTYPPQQQGGIAFLGTLCQSFSGQSGPHSFAYIYNSYNQLPTYSWSVEVMTHEMGHNFGSPHTHACFWGPNRDQTLDNCQNPENNGCAPGPAPTNGGTIMSYCHLTGYGINFSNGFGKEPGDLIRTNVENKTCLSSQFTPTIVANVNSPYFDGDNIILKARPNKGNYSFDWFHYDYLMPVPKDSILRPTYSGIYKSAISTNPCTEYSQPDTVSISDFLVNLGCPVIEGFRDSFVVSLTMDADNLSKRDTLTVPDSLYLKVPAGVKDVLVELQTKISPMGSSWTRDVIMAYQAPASVGIINNKYSPNSGEAVGFKGEKSYKKILGKFNPKGDWYFITNDVKLDNGIDAKVTFSIVISWRLEDSIPPCRIALCDGQSKTFDAGIPGAKYTWSTGATTKTINTNQVGPLSVQVTKGSKKSSHEVELYNYPTNYTQSHTICQGDTVTIGKHHYTKAGAYIDTLKSFNACDSIITSTVEVLPTQTTDETVYVCFGELRDSIAFFKDSQLVFHHTAINGCDSMHLVNIKVNPEIKIQYNAVPACPEIGGSLEASASGGSGMEYQFEWSNGKSTNKIDSISSGIYQVKATDSTGCSLTRDVELKNLDSVGVVQLVFNISCFGKDDGRIYLDFISGVSPFIINWSNGEHTKDILQLIAGKYTVMIQDANGCQLEKVIDVTTPELLLIDLEVVNSRGNDGSAKANVTGGTMPYRYEWSTGETTPEIQNLKPGNYFVKVTDQNGCESRFDFAIQEITATNNVDHNDFIKLFPIPVRDQLMLSIESADINRQDISLKIYDVHSRKLHSLQFNAGEKLHAIDVSELAAGVYLLELQAKEKIVLRKLFMKD